MRLKTEEPLFINTQSSQDNGQLAMKKYDNTKRLIEINVEEEQKSVNSSNPKKETKPTFKVLQALAPIANL